MDKELIERLWAEADHETRNFIDPTVAERFAALIAEECAKVAEQHHLCETSMGPMTIAGSAPLAFAIRHKFKAE